MINTDDFVKRLQTVMDFYSESSSSFAEKIGVQRSSISHILSGRNKPSLDFVLKILTNFPEVNLYWLLNGKGTFPSETKKDMAIPESTQSDIKNAAMANSDKTITRIVLLYSDGSFQSFDNL